MPLDDAFATGSRSLLSSYWWVRKLESITQAHTQAVKLFAELDLQTEILRSANLIPKHDIEHDTWKVVSHNTV